MRGRDRSRMIYDILTNAQMAIVQTNLQSRANLSHISFKRHIGYLLECVLIEDVSDLYPPKGDRTGRTWYLTTRRGREWCEAYEKLIDIEKGGRSE